MSNCAVCDAELQPEQKTCHICGSHVEAAPDAQPIAVTTNIPVRPAADPVSVSVSSPAPASMKAGGRECPACGKQYAADFNDDFCSCGTELRERTDSSGNGSALASASVPSPAVELPDRTVGGSSRPPAGTICLVLYSDTKPRQPTAYFPLSKDVVVIGRQDAVRGDFPDVDLGTLVEEAVSRKVSRRHAEILRARSTQTFSLRPFPGNTGTQIGKELAVAGQEYPLTDGTPIILGGAIWMKFETMK